MEVFNISEILVILEMLNIKIVAFPGIFLFLYCFFFFKRAFCLFLSHSNATIK